MNKEGKKNKERRAKDEEDQQDEEIDLSGEDDIYLSKLQNMAIYLRHINSRLFECLHFNRKPTSKATLLNVVNNFDKCIDDYNIYYLRRRMSRLLFFKIDPLAIQREEQIFVEKLYIKQRNSEDRAYFIRFIYSKGKDNYYRMHVEIWKHDGHTIVTNQILTRFEKNLTNDLIDGLKERGFVSNYEDSCVILKGKRPNHRNPNKIMNEQLNLMDCIESIAQNFLRQMVLILSNEQCCVYCTKHLIYESRVGLMMPPTVIVASIGREQTTGKFKLLHEACSLKYMKSPALSMDQRQQHQHPHQNPHQNPHQHPLQHQNQAH